MLEIGFIEEKSSPWGNKETGPQAIFHKFFYLQKYDLICLNPHYWQPCILQFCDITKDWFCKFLRL